MVPVLKGHHTVFFKYDPLVNRKYPNRCPKQFETACEGFSVSSGRDGGRAELCSFMYLFIYFLQEGRRSVFVCSVSTSMFLKVHRGTLRKAPTGGGELLPAADGHLWLSSPTTSRRLLFPFLTASGSVSVAAPPRPSVTQSGPGFSLISLHVELLSTRLGPPSSA